MPCYVSVHRWDLRLSGSITARLLIDTYIIALPLNFEPLSPRLVPDRARKEEGQLRTNPRNEYSESGPHTAALPVSRLPQARLIAKYEKK